MSKGIYVFVLNSTDYPLGSTPSPYLASPGIASEIRVARWHHKEQTYPYGHCIVQSDNSLGSNTISDYTYYYQTLQTNYNYRQSVCLDFCFQALTNSQCGCSNYWINVNNTGYDWCLTSTQRTCADNLFANTYMSGTYISTNCAPKCPSICEFSEFHKTVSHYAYPPSSVYVEKRLQHNASMVSRFSGQTDFTTDLISHMAQITVFYEKTGFYDIEEDPKFTLFSLLGELGGCMHLFLGMSVVSCIELIELVFRGLIIACTEDPTQVKDDGDDDIGETTSSTDASKNKN